MKNTLFTETFAKDAQGAIWLNDPVQYLKGGVLAPLTMPPSPALAAGSRSAPIRFEAPTDGYSEITDLIGVRGANDDVESTLYSELVEFSGHGERNLQNRPVLASHMFGSAQQPFLLSQISETLLLAPQGCLVLKLDNASAGTTSNFSPVMKEIKAQLQAARDPSIAAQLKAMKQKKLQVVPYWFTMDQSIGGRAGVSIAAAGQTTISFSNKIDATLVLVACMASAVSTGIAGDTQEKFAARTINMRNEQNLDNQFVPWNCGYGSAALPFIMPTPILVRNRQGLTLQVKNLITDQATKVFITFFGAAIFR